MHHPTKEDSYHGITEGVEEEEVVIDDYNEEAERRRQKELERGNRDLEREIRDMEREKRNLEVKFIFQIYLLQFFAFLNLLMTKILILNINIRWK